MPRSGARTERRWRTLGKLFKDGKIGKTYWALVEGGPEEDEGTIDLPLGRRDETRGWWMKVDPAGQPSMTTWKVMGRADGKTWLALEPVTGRTHQLRVHCQAKGWPMVGDNIYGTAPRFDEPGLQLLAREIVVPLYKNRDPIRVTAPVPPHMREGLKACGWVGDQRFTDQGSPDEAQRNPGPNTSPDFAALHPGNSHNSTTSPPPSRGRRTQQQADLTL